MPGSREAKVTIFARRRRDEEHIIHVHYSEGDEYLNPIPLVPKQVDSVCVCVCCKLPDDETNNASKQSSSRG